MVVVTLSRFNSAARVEFLPFRLSGKNIAKRFSLQSSVEINKKENTRRGGYDVPARFSIIPVLTCAMG